MAQDNGLGLLVEVLPDHACVLVIWVPSLEHIASLAGLFYVFIFGSMEV